MKKIFIIPIIFILIFINLICPCFATEIALEEDKVIFETETGEIKKMDIDTRSNFFVPGYYFYNDSQLAVFTPYKSYFLLNYNNETNLFSSTYNEEYDFKPVSGTCITQRFFKFLGYYTNSTNKTLDDVNSSIQNYNFLCVVNDVNLVNHTNYLKIKDGIAYQYDDEIFNNKDKLVTSAMVSGLLDEIVGLLPVIIPALILFIAIRKGLSFLISSLRRF